MIGLYLPQVSFIENVYVQFLLIYLNLLYGIEDDMKIIDINIINDRKEKCLEDVISF